MTETAPMPAVHHWVERLFAISKERQVLAQEQLARWAIPHIADELSRPTADASVSAVLLAESVERLVERGVDEGRLLTKLRRDPDLWPTWAEIRAAGLLASHLDLDSEFLLEPDRVHGGRHADFAFLSVGGERHSVEFKAIGLSDQEAAFAASMTTLLPGLMPRFGVSTLHLLDTDVPVALSRTQRRQQRRLAERLAGNLPPAIQQIAAAVIVGHGTEDHYLRRLTHRFSAALEQLPPKDPCWVAFHWSNGAPFDMIRRVLAGVEIPDHVAGVVILGSVAIPGRLENYTVFIPAPFHTEDGEELWDSDSDIKGAKLVLTAVDSSGGVRATYIRVPWDGRSIDFLIRMGERRILPFNVILDPDPPAVARQTRPSR